MKRKSECQSWRGEWQKRRGRNIREEGLTRKNGMGQKTVTVARQNSGEAIVYLRS